MSSIPQTPIQSVAAAAAAAAAGEEAVRSHVAPRLLLGEAGPNVSCASLLQRPANAMERGRWVRASCADRARWLVAHRGAPATEALRTVAAEFPRVCGAIARGGCAAALLDAGGQIAGERRPTLT